MTTQEINIGITASDVNQVISENPQVGLQLRIAALSRVIEEKEARIQELEAKQSDSSKPKQKV